MPESLDVDLHKMKTDAHNVLEQEGGKHISIEEKPIAFGLKALIVKTEMPEERGTDVVESRLSTISGVSSVTIEDYRRAFG